MLDIQVVSFLGNDTILVAYALCPMRAWFYWLLPKVVYSGQRLQSLVSRERPFSRGKRKDSRWIAVASSGTIS